MHEAEHQAKRKAEGRTGQRGTSGSWRKARAAALKRDRHRCVVCGTRYRLAVHHRDGNPRNDALVNLITLCNLHHRSADTELRALARRGGRVERMRASGK